MNTKQYPLDREIEIGEPLSNEDIADLLNGNFGFNLVGGDIPTLHDLGAISISVTSCRFNYKACHDLSTKHQYNNMIDGVEF